jgi:tetratricopeptide (TPR) repeat protein
LIRQDPRAEHYLLLAVLEARKQYWHRAQAAVESALRLHPDHAEATLLLAQVLEAKNEREQAEEVYRSLVEAHPCFSRGFREYARFLMTHTDSISTAQRLLMRSLEMNPRDALAHTLLAEIYLLRGRTGQAFLHLEIAAHYHEEHPLFHESKAKLLMEMERYEEAAKQLRRALRMDPKNERIRLQYAEALRAANTPRFLLFWKRFVI